MFIELTMPRPIFYQTCERVSMFKKVTACPAFNLNQKCSDIEILIFPGEQIAGCERKTSSYGQRILQKAAARMIGRRLRE
jgi:hypothetical protein